MKRKLTIALCAALLLAGFFGLQAVSESSLSLWEGAGAILAILVALLLVVKVANRLVDDDTPKTRDQIVAYYQELLSKGSISQSEYTKLVDRL